MQIQNVIIPPASVTPAATAFPTFNTILGADDPLTSVVAPLAVISRNMTVPGIYVVSAWWTIANSDTVDHYVEATLTDISSTFARSILNVPAGGTASGSFAGIVQMANPYVSLELTFLPSAANVLTVKATTASGSGATGWQGVQVGT